MFSYPDSTGVTSVQTLTRSATLGHAPASRPILWPASESALLGLMRRVLDELDYGVIMVDVQGEVCLVNRTARSDHARAGLHNVVVGERLVAGTTVETAELMAAIRDAVQLSRRSLVRLGTGMRQCIAVVPLGEEQPDGGGQALLLFGRDRVCAPISIAFFARTFRRPRSPSATAWRCRPCARS
jgi:hypothetical protein